MKTTLPILLTLVIFVLFSSNVQADSQLISLKKGWNLISLSVNPQDSSPDVILNELISSQRFTSLWAFNAVTKQWETFPQITSVPLISALKPGKGYWINVTENVDWAVEGNEQPVQGNIELYPGWNLIGFPIKEATDYSNIVSGIPYAQFWGFNKSLNQFEGIEIVSGGDTILRQDFSTIQPGKGYWLYSTSQFTPGPKLTVHLPPDIDQEPFLEKGEYGTRVPWNEMSPGDKDLDTLFDNNREVFFDPPNTQSTIYIDGGQFEQIIHIFNSGNGVLSWKLSIDDPENASWLSLVMLNSKGEEVDSNVLSGVLTKNTQQVYAKADRFLMAAGDYRATLTLSSNGSDPEFSEKRINVLMTVPDLVGDYKMKVKIEMINGKEADMHNPVMYLSIYRDNESLKGIIDEKRTMLMPKRFYMTGNYIGDTKNSFALSGSLKLPAKNPENEFNPYETDIDRDITLIGERGGPQDYSMRPLDLKGEYRETVSNLLGDPIYLKGTFEAKFLDDIPRQDSLTANGKSGIINDEGSEILISKVNYPQNMIITELNVHTDIEHPRPEDLTVRLVAPIQPGESPDSGRHSVVLRQNSIESLTKQIFDINSIPVENLDLFNGMMSKGEWQLVIEDSVAGESGRLLSWALDVEGTRVFNLAGFINNVPPGTKLLLTGCGVAMEVEVNEEGRFLFENLISCNYRLRVLSQGYAGIYEDIFLDENKDYTDDTLQLELSPVRIVTEGIDFKFSPVLGNVPMLISMHDVSDISGDTSNLIRKWTLYKQVEGVSIGIEQQQESTGETNEFVINTPGTYTLKMDLYRQLSGAKQLLGSVNKNTDFILVGTMSSADFKMVQYSMSTNAGFYTGNIRDGYFMDSATFDIDRPPVSPKNSPGIEDSNHFGSKISAATQTNENIPNNSLDPPVGMASKHFRAFVSIGGNIVGGYSYMPQSTSEQSRKPGNRLNVGIQHH